MSTRRLTIKSEQSDSLTVGMRLFDLLRLVLMRKKLIAVSTLTVAILTAAVVLLIPNEYKSTATILPTGKSDKMAELKALAGLSSSMSADANSSDLFPSILQSQMVRDAVLNHSYSFNIGETKGPVVLSDYYDLTNADKLRAALAGNTGIHADRKTGVITVAFASHYPELSRQVLERYLQELENFNLYKRRSSARENALYLEQQVNAKQRELAVAEEALKLYQKVNRDWAGTSNPEILANLAKLQREAEVKNQTYLYLTREYEIAKFEAQKDMPIVRILDSPSLPATKSYPKRGLAVAMATVMAFIASLAFVLGGEVVRQVARGREKESFDQFRTQLTEDFPRTAQVVDRLKHRKTPVST